MEENKGYTVLTLGVEPEETRNKEIYKHYGFIEHIKNDKEIYPDGTEIDVEYYRKEIVVTVMKITPSEKPTLIIF